MIQGNNPGNLKYDDRFQWQGLASPPMNAAGFCLYLTAEAGLRALAIDIRNQQLLHGLRTLRGIVLKYAPPGDGNAVQAYLDDLRRRTGFAPMQPLDLTKRDQLRRVMVGIIWHENGECPYSQAQIDEAVMLALPDAAASAPTPAPKPKPAAPAPATVTPQGAAAAAGGSGLLMVILQSELQRRHVNIEPQELVAIATLFAPVLHTLARIFQAVSSALVLRFTGVDIGDGDDTPFGASP